MVHKEIIQKMMTFAGKTHFDKVLNKVRSCKFLQIHKNYNIYQGEKIHLNTFRASAVMPAN